MHLNSRIKQKKQRTGNCYYYQRLFYLRAYMCVWCIYKISSSKSYKIHNYVSQSEFHIIIFFMMLAIFWLIPLPSPLSFSYITSDIKLIFIQFFHVRSIYTHIYVQSTYARQEQKWQINIVVHIIIIIIVIIIIIIIIILLNVI